MELIIDANILMSALISTQGSTFDLIFNNKIKLFAPEYLFEEIDKYKQVIIEKSGLLESDLDLFISLVLLRIELIPKIELSKFLNRAELISPDPNDSEYFALALKLNCAIWSNDKKLKSQYCIKVYNTQEIISLI